MLLALAGLFSAEVARAQDCPLRAPPSGLRTDALPDNRLFTIDVGDRNLEIAFHWDDLPAPPPDAELPELVTILLGQVETAIATMDGHGFAPILGGSGCGGRPNVYEVFVYEHGFTGGEADKNHFEFRFTEDVRNSNEIDIFSLNSIYHEVFHSTQFSYPTLSDFPEWLKEGTATLVPDLFDADLDASKFDLPPGVTDTERTCEVQYLQQPGANFVRLESRFRDGTNNCMTKLFWRYFTEQIGADRTEPGVGVDALVELFELLSERPSGWRILEDDRVIGAGDFDGDGREELLVQSATHIGLLAPTFGHNRILNVTAVGATLGSRGWRLASTDRLSSIGDYNGDGKDEVVIQSDSHIGFIGLDRRNRLYTLNSVLLGEGRFGGGWVPNVYDRLMGVADADGDGLDELLLSNDRYVGLVGLASNNATRSLAIRARGGLDDDAVRILGFSAAPRGEGDLDGDGRAEFVVVDDNGIFAFGLTAAGQFRVLASADYGDALRIVPEPGALPTGRWVLPVAGVLQGIGNIVPTRRAGVELVYQGVDGFAILAYNGVGGFVARRAYGVGSRFQNGSVYAPDLDIVAVADMNAGDDADIVFRQGVELGILQWTGPVKGLGQIGSLNNNDIPAGKLSTAALTGGADHVLVRAPAIWRTFAYYEASGIVEEANPVVGQYLDDLTSRMDELIRARTSGARTFDSLWRDFTIALNTKDLQVRSLAPTDYFIDEQMDNYRYHHVPGNDGGIRGPDGPPVPAVVTVDPGRDTGRRPEQMNAWSAHYMHVNPSATGQRVLVSILPVRGTGRLSVNAVITEGARLVRIDRDANRRGGALLRYYDLAPGQELALVLSAADASPEYSYRLRSTLP